MTSPIVWVLQCALLLLFQQSPYRQFAADRQRLQTQAQQAFDAEMAREKAGDCNDANNTYDQVTCYGKESQKSATNYKAFAAAIRAMIGQKPPFSGDAASGPTGQPLTPDEMTKEFDQLESAWSGYEKIEGAAAFDRYKGGTLAPVFSLEAGQHMLRSHMRELRFLYGDLFL